MELLDACSGISRAQTPVGEQILRLWRFEQWFYTCKELHRAHARCVLSGHDHHRFAFLQTCQLDQRRALQHGFEVHSSTTACLTEVARCVSACAISRPAPSL